MGNIVIENQEMTVQYSSPRYYWSIGDLTWRSLWGFLALGRFVSSTVALLVLLHYAKTFSCKERFSRLWGQREKNKKERRRCFFIKQQCGWRVGKIFLFVLCYSNTCIRGKLIWFLDVQHNLTSSDFLEWKKRLNHEEANIFIILLSWSSLKREHVLFSMIEGKLPRHMTWSELASSLIFRFPFTEIKKQPLTVDHNK